MVYAARGGDNPLIEHGWQREGKNYTTKKGRAEVHCVSQEKRIYETNAAGLEQLKTEQIIRVFDDSKPGEVRAYVEHARKTKKREYEVYYQNNPFSKYMDEGEVDKANRYVVTIWVKDDDATTAPPSTDSSRRSSFEKN